MSINRREKILLISGIILIALLVYYFAIASPALVRNKKIKRYIAKKERDLEQITALKRASETFEKKRIEAEDLLKRRGKRFTLLSYLESVSRSKGINTKIQYMKPIVLPEEEGPLDPDGIEIGFNGISMDQLLYFLQAVEQSGKLLNIKRIKIQKDSDRAGASLKVTMQILTYTGRTS